MSSKIVSSSTSSNAYIRSKKRSHEKHESSTIISKYMSSTQKYDPPNVEKRSLEGAQALLEQFNLQADDNSKDMLAELILSVGTRLIREADDVASINGRNEILQGDVDYAGRQLRDYDSNNTYAIQCALEAKMNAIELPKPRNMDDCFRMPLGYCINQPIYDTRVIVVQPPMQKEEYLPPPPKKTKSEIEISHLTAAFKIDEEDYD